MPSIQLRRRALLWQQDAVERNADRIEKEQAAYTKAGESKGYDASKTLQDEGFRKSMEQAYGPVWDKRGNANYEVTFTTYLRGLVLMGRGDASSLDQARQSFKSVAGMLGEPANAAVLQDVAMADDATRGIAPPKMVWVLLETGRAPSRKEFRLDIPLFMQQVPPKYKPLLYDLHQHYKATLRPSGRSVQWEDCKRFMNERDIPQMLYILRWDRRVGTAATTANTVAATTGTAGTAATAGTNPIVLATYAGVVAEANTAANTVAEAEAEDDYSDMPGLISLDTLSPEELANLPHPPSVTAAVERVESAPVM